MVGFFILYLSASVSWLATLLVSPLWGVVLSLPAGYGFLKLAEGFDAWSRDGVRVYEAAAHASRAGAVAVAAATLGAERWLSAAEEAWLVRLGFYALWSGLWILYYYVLMAVAEGARLPVTTTALSLSTLLSPLLTEALPASPEAKTALAVAMYAGFMPPLNTSALLAALLTRR